MMQPDKDPGRIPTEGEPTRDYPPAEQSLQAARKLVGPATGAVKIIRRFVGAGIALWKVEAKLRATNGPDYELEVEGESLDEVSFALVDALEQCGFSVEDQ